MEINENAIKGTRREKQRVNKDSKWVIHKTLGIPRDRIGKKKLDIILGRTKKKKQKR